MFDLFRRLTGALDHFKGRHPKAIDRMTVIAAVGLCLVMLALQIHKLIG